MAVKTRWLALIDEYSGGNENQNGVSVDTVQNVVGGNVPAEMETAPTDSASDSTAEEDLPIFEATAREINYWHACGCNVFLQTYLRRYDFDYSSPNVAVYNYFKIGLDEKRRVATFAIDATHYYGIEFGKNWEPLDAPKAKRVLMKLDSLTR